MYQSGSLQYRQLGTSQLKKQGARLHPSELTHRNEQWVECSIAEVHRDITEKYKEATGQGLQKKATPIREGVIVISEETTIQQLQDLAEKLEERFGVHAFQIYTHKDEGANVWDGKEEAWKPNYHAHMIFDWTDGHTGKL